MIIAVDFDGTIVEHAYPAIGKPIPFAIDVLKRLQTECHHQLILWTVREDELLEEAVNYCRERGLEFYAVNKSYPEETIDDNTPRKLSNVEMWIDDRNIGGLPDWGIIYRMVKYNESSIEAARYIDNSKNQETKKKGFLSFLKK